MAAGQNGDGPQGGRTGQPGIPGSASSVQLNFQLLNLTSTIQSQQADLQFYEARVCFQTAERSPAEKRNDHVNLLKLQQP